MADCIDLTFDDDSASDEIAEPAAKRPRAGESVACKTNPEPGSPEKAIQAQLPPTKVPHLVQSQEGLGSAEGAPAVSPPTNSLLDTSPPTNSLLASLHRERIARQLAKAPDVSHAAGQAATELTTAGRGGINAQPAAAAGSVPESSSTQDPVTLLTYNVWFREDVALLDRMAGIEEVIKECNYPHFICFQEVTPNILSLWTKAAWWQRYHASPVRHQQYFTLLLARRDGVVLRGKFQDDDYSHSQMGRGLLRVSADVAGRRVHVATTHLESPFGGEMFSVQRMAQVKEALARLAALQDDGEVLFAGDMNWNDKRDGVLPLGAGWCDAWQKANPGSVGFTYDMAANAMLVGRWPGSRLDRVLCRLREWEVSRVQLVGTRPLCGKTYEFTSRNGVVRTLPVLPSDHFGLLATFSRHRVTPP